MSTYRIDLDNLTVIRTDEHGERHDLTGDGQPCDTYDDLREWVIDLETMGAYSADVTADLLAQIP